ncbi:DUF1049 domain-containing protein [Falsirhodobacter algicola]|uniref:DUF1049 domain-containing protein n=2 Tax=Falsirhodobacter algicola TaxID=2692330 RepID=A0A8J8MUG7_9RHOB|nr:DUF1049 domain-containing protein [Falsirhodobacter algicola]
MRWIRIVFIVLLAILLLAVAIANRQLVTLRLLPDTASSFFGFGGSIQLPLFLVILGAAALGLLIGFVWEYVREHRIRADAQRTEREAQRLREELATTRKEQPRDDVLALLDQKAV